MHASLQRLMIREIHRIATDPELGLQVFLTTHSPTLIDFGIPHKDVRIFEANGWTV